MKAQPEIRRGFDTLFQQVVSEHFPNADLLPFDSGDGVATCGAVFAHRTGNDLFRFVFNELADVKSQAEALDRLERARADLQACMDVIIDTGTV